MYVVKFQQMQTSADKARNRIIGTALVLSVMQGGYFTIYWCDEFRYADK